MHGFRRNHASQGSQLLLRAAQRRPQNAWSGKQCPSSEAVFDVGIRSACETPAVDTSGMSPGWPDEVLGTAYGAWNLPVGWVRSRRTTRSHTCAASIPTASYFVWQSRLSPKQHHNDDHNGGADASYR